MNLSGFPRRILPWWVRWLLLAFAAAGFWAPSAALACTQPPGGLENYSIAERAQVAPIVLEGTVTAVTGDYILIATVDVARYFKGSGVDPVQITNFGSGAMCLRGVSPGEHLIIFARPSPDVPDQLTANYREIGDAAEPATDAAIQEVIAAVGGPGQVPAPAPAPAPSNPQLPRELPATAAEAGQQIMIAGLAIILAFGGLAIAWSSWLDRRERER